ncbi:uncharacterized protein [Miscanthus floridulus]|uniref:uncharacterized protein n=1 Tax=Miscanthus floridulus TaxID=154761 RepID=UPI003459D7F7
MAPPSPSNSDASYGSNLNPPESTASSILQTIKTVSKSIFDIIHKPNLTTFTLWYDVEGLFLENKLHHVIYLEAELRSLNQIDMTISEYYTKLKRLADQLRAIGHLVSEPSQVLNLL